MNGKLLLIIAITSVLYLLCVCALISWLMSAENTVLTSSIIFSLFFYVHNVMWQVNIKIQMLLLWIFSIHHSLILHTPLIVVCVVISGFLNMFYEANGLILVTSRTCLDLLETPHLCHKIGSYHCTSLRVIKGLTGWMRKNTFRLREDK